MTELTERQRRLYEIYIEEAADYVETFSEGYVNAAPGTEAHFRAIVFAKSLDRVLEEICGIDQEDTDE